MAKEKMSFPNVLIGNLIKSKRFPLESCGNDNAKLEKRKLK